MKPIKIAIVCVLMVYLFLAISWAKEQFAIDRAFRVNDVTPILNANTLEAKYHRALLAWNFAVKNTKVAMRIRQDIMEMAYREISEIDAVAPGYREINRIHTLMNEARDNNVRSQK